MMTHTTMSLVTLRTIASWRITVPGMLQVGHG